MKIDHILFPVDFSKRCVRTALFVQTLARKFGAKVTLLHAIQPLVVMGSIDGGLPVEFDMDALRASIVKQLNGWLLENWNGVDAERVVEEGEPAAVIVKHARSHGTGLIMMPSHGYGPFRRLLLGSVTSKVLHDAQCPVWTDAHAEDVEGQQHLSGRTLLCAVDRGPRSTGLIRWAADFAAATGGTLRVIHSVGSDSGFPERQFDREFQETLRQQARTEMEGLLKDAGVEAPLCIATGDPADGIRQEARGHGADLVIIGRGSIHEKLGRLRTHAHAIIRHSPCPVISV